MTITRHERYVGALVCVLSAAIIISRLHAAPPQNPYSVYPYTEIAEEFQLPPAASVSATLTYLPGMHVLPVAPLIGGQLPAGAAGAAAPSGAPAGVALPPALAPSLVSPIMVWLNGTLLSSAAWTISGQTITVAASSAAALPADSAAAAGATPATRIDVLYWYWGQ